MARLLGQYRDKTVENIFAEFDTDPEFGTGYNNGGHANPKREGFTILLAYHDNEDYSGSCFILGVRDGVLVEINGSHCSCHGFEGQWDEEPTTVEALRYALANGFGVEGYGDDIQDVYRTELLNLLDEYEAQSASQPAHES